MFVEKVKSIYKEEVRRLNEMGNINCRWGEYKEDKRFCTPYTVWFNGLEILGEKNTYIGFDFINRWTGYKLFRIEVTVIMNVEGRNLKEIKEMVESCKNKLIEKYGKPFEVKITEADEVDKVTREVEQEMEKETGEESRKVYRWVDENNNTLVFIDNLVGLTTIYTEGKLIKIWKSQVKKWKKENKKGWNIKKDIESF